MPCSKARSAPERDTRADAMPDFTLAQLAAHTQHEAGDPLEHRSRWGLPGYRGHDLARRLRSGLGLYASSCRWERAGAIVAEHQPSPLCFMISRGPGLRTRSEQGASWLVGGGLCSVSRVHGTYRARYEAPEGAHDEVVCLEVGDAQLQALLGTQSKPRFLAPGLFPMDPPRHPDSVRPGAHVRTTHPMTPELFALLDEILYCDASARTRQLYLDGKGLELLARLVDTFEQAADDRSAQLTQADVQRLQRARALLLARMEAPPSLPALARATGVNEAKLKAGFRHLFGTSVYGYLRRARMEEALRLLRARELNVSQVAARVGYANPSKFAAAFRRQFGTSPSSL